MKVEKIGEGADVGIQCAGCEADLAGTELFLPCPGEHEEVVDAQIDGKPTVLGLGRRICGRQLRQVLHEARQAEAPPKTVKMADIWKRDF